MTGPAPQVSSQPPVQFCCEEVVGSAVGEQAEPSHAHAPTTDEHNPNVTCTHASGTDQLMGVPVDPAHLNSVQLNPTQPKTALDHHPAQPVHARNMCTRSAAHNVLTREQ
jgi:hypothetical protein